MLQSSLPFFFNHNNSFYLFMPYSMQFHNILDDIFQTNANPWPERAAGPEP